jgi:hypothetical protein
MTKNTRSLSGAVLMLMIIPIIVGLLACMPVPIGDPERSRIDPGLNGPWAMDDGGDVNLYLYQPYDKRTWLVVVAQIEEGSEAKIDDLDIETAGDVFAALQAYPIGEDGITAKTTIAFKVWLTKLGGEQFMTWQPVGGMNSDGSFTPEYWFVFKVVKETADRINLYAVNPDYEGFEGITTPDDYEGDDYVGDMQRTWERALKKHAKDPELIADDPWVMHRVPASAVEKAAKLFQEVIEFD